MPVIYAPGYRGGNLAIRGPRPWIDATAYGADPTGVIDSSAAFQAAFDAGSGYRIYVPTGRYKIATKILLYHEHSMVIEGEASGIISTPGASAPAYTFAGGGAVLLNYTGGVMFEIEQNQDVGLPDGSSIVVRNLTFEAQNNTADVNVHCYVPSGEPSGRIFFQNCVFVRGYRSFQSSDAFDIAFDNCYFVGYPATGTGFTEAGKTAVYLTGLADMMSWNNCFFATWDTNVKVNAVAANHPTRLWFKNTRLESTRLTNCDIQNVEFAHFLDCHFEASAQADAALYHDVLFGNLVGGDSSGSVSFDGCTFAAGAYANVPVKAGPKFASLHMKSCRTSTTSVTASVVVDNSGVTGYGAHTMGSVIVEDCALHSGVSRTNFDGNYEVRGSWQPQDGLLLAQPFPPQVAVCSGAITLTASFADVTGCSQTLTPGIWKVDGTFFFIDGGDSGNEFHGTLTTTGGTATVQNASSLAIVNVPTVGMFIMPSQSWLVTVSATTTAKLRAKKSAGAGTSTCSTTHTTMIATKVG